MLYDWFDNELQVDEKPTKGKKAKQEVMVRRDPNLGPVRPHGICPACNVNPSPDIVYGEGISRRYVCNQCYEDALVLVEAMQPDIGRLREARMKREAEFEVRYAERKAKRDAFQKDLIEKFS